MTIAVEVGKHYRLATGQVVKIERTLASTFDSGPVVEHASGPANGRYFGMWRKDGRADMFGDGRGSINRLYDIVEEVDPTLSSPAPSDPCV